MDGDEIFRIASVMADAIAEHRRHRCGPMLNRRRMIEITPQYLASKIGMDSAEAAFRLAVKKGGSNNG